MQVVKYILMVLYIIDYLGLIIVTMMQNSDSRGASGTIVGSSSNNFYEKNKGRTREGKLKRWTIILGVAFVVLAVALGIVYVIKNEFWEAAEIFCRLFEMLNKINIWKIKHNKRGEFNEEKVFLYER